ncbi:isoamylase early set domain-containing protein [Streptomyces sp. NPDC003038]|uniref:isoamylase early set domain-containing protein n=1 Tax=unclassified Streptomyces TaxID=2593676 RepID=UPI0033ADD80C
MLERRQDHDHTEVTFILPAEAPAGPVSVVGDFNDWHPDTHPLRARADGTRAVSVTLPREATHTFRYLAAGDYWFNDDQADGQDGPNSRLET